MAKYIPLAHDDHSRKVNILFWAMPKLDNAMEMCLISNLFQC